MKAPIEPSDIKAGDTIERHWRVTVTTMPVARVKGSLAYSPEDYCMGLDTTDGESFYLLDRPTPPVELPEVATWGWLTYRDTDYPSANPTVELGEWKSRRDRVTVLDVHGSTSVPSAWVTAFTPATAIPTEALDELRHRHETRHLLIGDLNAFFAAVDKANGATS